MNRDMSGVARYFESMDYAPAPEGSGEARAWLESHRDGFGHFIGGAWLGAGRKGGFESRDPATGALLTTLAAGTADDVDDAVRAARAALAPWQAAGPATRARHLHALARMVQRRARLFAVVESLDNGKPIREARDIDIPLVARHFYHHAGWAQLQDSEFADYAPIGIVGQIIPWNFPLLMLAWKIAPALALGNTVVLKPAEYTSLSALLFAELAAAAGLPAGVLNIVTGDGATGAALVEHFGIDKIAFTGSTEVGRAIREKTAGSGKALTLELGGKSPFIVFDDADIDAAIEGVVDAIWLNQGQVCCAGSRLLVQEGIAELFIERLKHRMASLRVGNPLDKNVDMGAIVAPAQLERIQALVGTAEADGGSVYQPDIAYPRQGCFYPPTLITGVHSAATVVREEIFGPVLVASTFRTPDEAVLLANNTRYGLSASVWSETIGLALDIAPKLVVGVVWINAANLLDAAVGFGGTRESGFGREGGREGCLEYLKPKAWSGLALRAAMPPVAAAQAASAGFGLPAIDRTAKQFIGGKQVRPDSGHSIVVRTAQGALAGEVGAGNRKDIRNAVAAARGAEEWSRATAHHRAQVLYYLAENLSARATEFAKRLATLTGVTPEGARAEVEASISRLFVYGAWADKYEGRVHQPPLRGVALALPEPLGVVGVICPPEAPLLAFVSLVAPLVSLGNRVVVVPSERTPLVATDFYQVIETSDVPAGVVNIVTGASEALARTLADHDDVDGLWAFGSAELGAMVEKQSAGNLKRTLVDHGRAIDWTVARAAEGPILLRHAVQVKNVWIPYGD